MISEPERKILLAELSKSGSVIRGTHLIGITQSRLRVLRKASITLDEEVVAALAISADALELEARRRAVDGVEEPVFYKGDVVAHIRKFSDMLLRDLLRANKPEKFRERFDINHSGEVNITINGFARRKAT